MILLQAATELLATDDLLLDNLYKSIFEISVFVIACLSSFYLSFSDDNIINLRKNNLLDFLSRVLAFVIIIFFGFRTSWGVYIQDTLSYDWGWKLIGYNKLSFDDITFEGDWLFDAIELIFYKLGASFEIFMTFVAFVYIIPIFIISRKILNKQYWLFFIFCITSFTFFSGGVNGIRNAMASRLVMLGICFICDKNFMGYMKAFIVFIIASQIHHSVYATIICAILVLFIFKNPKIGILIWLIAIPIGYFMGNFGSLLGEWLQENTSESRLIDYASIEESSFSGDGFRWDFLLYSAIPVIMIWYVTIKRDFKDFIFNLIANTYVLTNAIWITLIRIPYNNRVANLSWALYPLVIAYPLLRFNLWKNQDKKVSLILFLYSGFTFIMYLFGK